MNQTKKTAAEVCRDAVRLAQKQLARATAAAAKAELPLERKLHAIGGELYGIADLLGKAMAPAYDPTGTVDNSAAFAPLPLRTPAEVVDDLETRQKIAKMLGVPLEHVHRLSVSPAQAADMLNASTTAPTITISAADAALIDEANKPQEPTHAQAA